MTATRPSQLAVTLPSDCEIEMTRTFDAPRRLVWAAHTDPAHVPHWLLGPPGWTMPVCEIDLRPDGAWRYVWRGEGRGEMSTGGTFLEVVPVERLVHTELWGGEPPAAIVTLLLTEEGDGRTRLTQTMRFPSQAVRDTVVQTGMSDGVATSYDRLDALLAAMG